MGAGSYFGRKVFRADVRKRLYVVSIAIVVVGTLLFVISPDLFAKSLEFELPLRAATTFLAILPLALLLGIPFPSCIQLLALGHRDRYIPWMYGVNGSMSVLGSVLAAILSMLYGFTPTYFVGLFFYLGVFLISFSLMKKVDLSSVIA
jgi:MFS family permease